MNTENNFSCVFISVFTLHLYLEVKNMEILHEEINGKGVFYIKDDMGKIAKLKYRRTADDKIIAEHTWVSPALEGKGVAAQLFDKLVDYTRKEKLKLSSDCSYVKERMEKKKEQLKDIIDDKKEDIKDKVEDLKDKIIEKLEK